ncbi:hypothetical protein [Streptomyces phaeofaciens]|uniref:hypothetical protein n=1 Tax=Streptomyces phaeofaciens TaxID=68254 RepID=UPI0036C3E46F
MLKFLGALDLPDATVYLDDADDLLGYVLPKNVVLRRNASGKAVFQLLKYRTPKPLPNGEFGAALLSMDVELSLTKDQENIVRKQLAAFVTARRGPGAPAVTPEQMALAKPPVSKASVTMDILAGSGQLVQKVNHAGTPSMYGNCVVAISAELTQFGAAVFEEAMNGMGSGGVRVVYSLHFIGRVPPLTVTGTWNASKFYSFVQEVDFEERFWAEDDFSEQISEIFVNSDSRRIHSDPGTLETSDPEVSKLLTTLESAVAQQLDDAVKRNLLEAIPPESRDLSKVRDEDFENIRREVTTHKIADVSIGISRDQVFGIDVEPQGNMASLVSQGFDWSEYAREVDANPAFFRRLNLRVRVNADFARLSIFSVDVTIDYPPHTAAHGVETFVFRTADDVARFSAFTDGGSTAFTYQYVVNYVGESRRFLSDPDTVDTTELTLNIDELGLWLVDIEVGDMNFEQVSRAVLTLEHPPVDGVTPPVARFQIDQHTTRLTVRELLLAPVQPYGGSVKYFMKDGREFVRKLEGLTGTRYFVDDPFSGNREVRVRTRGDFERDVETIFLELAYDDPINNYRQTMSFALSKDKRFLDWRFPVIDERAGNITYQAVTVFRRDGDDDDTGERPLSGSLLVLGPVSDTLTVTVFPDLVDWTAFKLVRLTLHYTDPEHQIDDTESFVFRKGDAEKTYERFIRDRNKKRYAWTAHFFPVDGGRPKPVTGEGTDEALILTDSV